MNAEHYESVSQNVHFSSRTDLWATPQDFFDKYNAVYSFTLDVCALPNNAKCHQYFTPEQDGLKQSWIGVCWMNPPYGREIGKWVRKAYESSEQGAMVVCPLPARTDTAWWHDYCMKGKIDFIRGRLKFGGHKNSAPFPSVIVIFGSDNIPTINYPTEPHKSPAFVSDPGWPRYKRKCRNTLCACDGSCRKTEIA